MRARAFLGAVAALALIAAAQAQTISSTPVPYAAGTWTPTLVSTGGGTPTYTTQLGFYEQIGRQMTVRFAIVLATAGTLGAGNLSIASLPVAASGTGMCTVSSYSVTGLTASNWGVVGTIADAATSLTLLSANNTTVSNISVAQAGATASFFGMCNYKVS